MNRVALNARALLLLLVVSVLMSCQGSGELPLDQVDPEAVPAEPTFQEVFAVLHRACVPCHQGDGEDEGERGRVGVGARPTAGDAEPGLDDCAEIVLNRDSILEQVQSDRMPPGAWPRLTSEEKLLLRRWIDTGAPAPCN